jgi:SAM-dependent methyltransferase
MMEKNLKRVLNSYWETLHHNYSSNDPLSPISNPGESPLVNKLFDFGHRLGMQEALKRLGRLEGKGVLDVGCGRGRWSREFARRGANVLGIDWSLEAIRLNQKNIPECSFECISVLELDRLGLFSFDVVNSVTVIQHTPRESHQKIFKDIEALLTTKGKLCMLESIYNPVFPKQGAYQSGACTFYWTKEEWIDLVEHSGFKLVYYKGCLYKPLLRLYFKLSRTQSPDPSSAQGAITTSRSTLKDLSALFSFPFELVSGLLPESLATHGIFIFEKAR